MAVILMVSIFTFMPQGNHVLTVNPQINSTGSILQKDSQTQSTPKPSQNSGGSFSSFTSAITQAIIPSKPLGVIESAQTINSTVWRAVAENAWAFYTPGFGVDPYTGLPYAASMNFRACTDWDLGAYIQSIIDAKKLGLIEVDGEWGFNDRINRVLTFLENRPLNTTTSNNWPFWFYDSSSGNGYQTTTTYASNTIDIMDTGRLLVALNNLRIYNNSCAQRVNNIVLHGRTNYSALVKNIQYEAASNDIYSYYMCSGFSSFWPQLSTVPHSILNNIINSGQVNVSSVLLPNATLCNEPLLCSIFELNNSDSSKLKDLMFQVYLAHEAYYNSTDCFAATSEGSSRNNGWIVEWVVGPSGKPWEITGSDRNINCSNLTPVIFNKVAYSFLALYNTTYARNTAVYLERLLSPPEYGYCDGADKQGWGVYQVSNNGNTMILEAARYAIQK